MRILENDCLRVSVSDAGAELCSVIDKTTGEERIWTADPSLWNRHAPILFPFVGKVTGGVYRIGTATYPMPTQHGFARDLPFTCVEADPQSVTHLLNSDAGTKARYPYEFSLIVRHALDSDRPQRLHVFWTVENTGDAPMYYAIGGHPGFLPPQGIEKTDCRFAFAGSPNPVHFPVTPGGFALPDQTVPIEAGEDGTVPFDASMADTWIFADGQVQSVSFCRPDGAPYVTLSCPGFPFLAVWSKPGAPFVCLEPWFGRTDDDGFSGTIDQKPGEQVLLAGATQTCSYTIDFFH